jgi:3-phenylpropionate/cinnamic acid dioxygenase small subunit
MTVADKLDIHELLYRYAELVDAGDFEGVGALLARGAFAGVRGAGPIAQLFASMVRRFPDGSTPTGTPRTRHLVLNPIVEVAGDTATARSTFFVVQATDTLALQPIAVGRYADTFARDADGWFFTDRQTELELVGDVSAHLLIDPRAFDH